MLRLKEVGVAQRGVKESHQAEREMRQLGGTSE